MLTKPASKTKRPTRRSGEAIQRPEGPTATRAEPTNLVPVDRVMMLSGWPDFLWSRAMFASCGPFETNASSAPGKTAMSAGFPCAGTLSGGDLPEGSIRQIEPSSWFATQTPLPSTATADGPLPTPMVLSTRFVVGSIRMSRPEVVGPPAPPRVRKKAASAAPISATPTTATASGQRLRFGSAIPSACRASSTSSPQVA